MTDDTRKNLEASVLQSALRQIIEVAQSHHPSYTTLSYIAEHAQHALEIVQRSRERALIEEAKSGGPIVQPEPARLRKRIARNVIPFDPHFRRKHKDGSL